MSAKVTRRKLLVGMGSALAASVLYACAPKATPAPTTAPAQATSAATAAAGATSAPAATTAPVATSAPASGPKPTLRSTLWAEQSGEGRTWMGDRAQEWAQETGIANVEVETVSYNEMPSRMLTAAATGTLWDVFFNNIRWGPTGAHKGVFLFLDDLVAANNTDMSDFVPAAVEGCTFEGKLYAMPAEINTGNQNIVFYNKELLDRFEVPVPTEDWDYIEFCEMAAKATDRPNLIFGTNELYSGSYYDFSAHLRRWGTDVFDQEGKQWTLGTDATAQEALQAHINLRTQYNAAPNRDESTGVNFYAGQISMMAAAVYTIVQAKANIEDKFEWDCLLGATGPEGLRGYSLFILMMGCGANTRYPQEAYQLLAHLTSQETAEWALVNQGQPTARLSVMRGTAASQVHPLWGRVADWLEDGVNRGPLPIPWNLRSQEINDTWVNLAPAMMFGEVPMQQGINEIQTEIQRIMDQPRP